MCLPNIWFNARKSGEDLYDMGTAELL